jgi:hypothetical protein
VGTELATETLFIDVELYLSGKSHMIIDRKRPVNENNLEFFESAEYVAAEMEELGYGEVAQEIRELEELSTTL